MWKENRGAGIRIAVVDSGVNVHHPDLAAHSFTGVSVVEAEDGYRVSEDIVDTLGHGTAVTGILKRLVPDAEIVAVKVFQEQLSANLEHLLYALQYVLDNIDCHILHLSLGVVQDSEIKRLRGLCEALTAKGVLIVSAFDNDGAVSYPAAFPEVIGVDASQICKGDHEFEFVEDSMVNLRAKGTSQRLAWVQPTYIFRGGASFAAAYASASVAKLREAGLTDREEILATLKPQSLKVFLGREVKTGARKFPMERAVIFPFNKEMHSVARFQDLLQFELPGVYDTKYSGQVGQPISKVLRQEVPDDLVIQNFDLLDWNGEWDTFILGHVELLSEKVGVEFVELVLNQCIEYRKNLYCYDGLSRYEELVQTARARGLHVFYPEVTTDEVPANRFGKLRKIGKPVLGIFGTSSQQGKFTLQLNLRRRFLRDGYGVGQLGTEPSALLYGFDEVYPMGYNSTVDVMAYQAVTVLNEMMWRIEDNDPDIILVGSQSGTVPYDTGNLRRFTYPAIDFLLGTQPDAFVLCCNVEDDIAYIRRAVQVLENLGTGKVIGLGVFPLRKQFIPWAGVKMNRGDDGELTQFKDTLQAELGLKAFLMNDDEELEMLYQQILEFYS
ncbi:S8 family serine peptidase [Tumebacillus sp. ITR2]|uniref:S8 family serine peptidase n=1 Tax=Tumebacillus amylolyticus TaxID=2801339 RepID=A0ABS1JBQ1_9BACL|nr:S8 family serine peptidase [Tumebacillus amylolyticus]MBL0387693.1 S8 family serine peptidase [Tumebacillus amylolyticus]